MSSGVSKFDRSWQLLKGSFQVIGGNRKLLLFPVVSFAFTLMIVLFFLAPVVLAPTGHSLADPAHWRAVVDRIGVVDAGGRRQQMVFHDTTYAYIAVIYLVSMVCATFFNVAFYSEILKALRGESVSVRSGLAFACSRIRPILLWSLFAGLVGLVIKGLEQRFGWVGRLVLRFIGMVWSVASVFAIPVIVCEEESNPVVLLRHSAETLRKTWGESLIGYVGITFASWIVLLVSLVLLIGGVIVSILIGHPMLILLFVLAWIVSLFAFGYIMAVANHIYRCALYVYASSGAVPQPFTTELMDGAWKVKKA